MRLRDYFALFRQRWALALTIILAVTGGTVLLGSLQDPSYTAAVRLRARPPAPGSTANPSLIQEQSDLGTEAELVRSAEVAERVVEKLDLSLSPDDALEHVQVVGLPNTAVLLIQTSADGAVTATNLANAFADAYLEIRRRDAARLLDQQTTEVESRLTAVQQRLAESEAKLKGLDPNSLEHATVVADREAALRDRSVLLEQLTNLSERRQLASGFGQIIQPATKAETVSARSVPRTAVFGMLIGLPLALAVILLLDTFTDAVQTVADAEEHTGAEVLGLVPRDEAWTNRNITRLVSEIEPYSPVAESYRTLAQNLRSIVGEGSAILITSPGPAEGKTTTAVNLAVAYSDGGRRAVLVEADLRNPRAYQFLGADFTPGVADVLRGDVDARGALQRLRPRLSYLGPGLPAGRADLLLLRADLRRLFADLASLAGPPATRPLRAARAGTRGTEDSSSVVLVDAPPVLSAAEVSSLINAVDAVVLVVRSGSTKRGVAARAADQIRRAGGNLVGTVLVGVRSLDDAGAPRHAREQQRDRGDTVGGGLG